MKCWERERLSWFFLLELWEKERLYWFSFWSSGKRRDPPGFSFWSSGKGRDCPGFLLELWELQAVLRAGSWGSRGELSTFIPSRSLLHSLQPHLAAEGTKSPNTQGHFSSQFLCHRGRAAPKNSPARQERSILMLHLPLSALYLSQPKSLSPAQPGQGDIGSAVPRVLPCPAPNPHPLLDPFSLPTFYIPTPELCFAPCLDVPSQHRSLSLSHSPRSYSHLELLSPTFSQSFILPTSLHSPCLP